MLSPVERVLILKGADLLKDVGPRHLLGLAQVAREIDMAAGDAIYGAEDPADALYLVVQGHVQLMNGERTISEVGPGEAFGTWALVDESARGHSAVCTESGLALALHRDEFYDIAAGDLTLLQQVVRALAKRLRALVSDRPEEARVEKEGTEKPEAMVSAEVAETAAEIDAAADGGPVTPGVPEPPSPSAGTELSGAATGRSPEPPPEDGSKREGARNESYGAEDERTSDHPENRRKL